jgi:hypothetical protein
MWGRSAKNSECILVSTILPINIEDRATLLAQTSRSYALLLVDYMNDRQYSDRTGTTCIEPICGKQPMINVRAS